MKYFFLVIIISFCLSCQQKNKSNSEDIKAITITENFDWLLGKWKRINDKAGKQTYENWIKLSEGSYQGLGYTMQNSDTIWKETIRLVHTNNAWIFEVKGKDESEPTIFKLIEIKEAAFTCENEENEFPKKIKYSKSGEKLMAIISGGDIKISFEYESINRN